MRNGLLCLLLLLVSARAALAVPDQSVRELAEQFVSAWEMLNNGDPALMANLIAPEDLQELKNEAVKAYGIAQRLMIVKRSVSSLPFTRFGSSEELAATSPKEVFIALRKQKPAKLPTGVMPSYMENPKMEFFGTVVRDGRTVVIFKSTFRGRPDRGYYMAVDYAGGKFHLMGSDFWSLDSEIERNLKELGEWPGK